MTARFKKSVMKYIKAKHLRVGKLIRKICGNRIFEGKYRIADTYSGHR